MVARAPSRGRPARRSALLDTWSNDSSRLATSRIAGASRRRSSIGRIGSPSKSTRTKPVRRPEDLPEVEVAVDPGQRAGSSVERPRAPPAGRGSPASRRAGRRRPPGRRPGGRSPRPDAPRRSAARRGDRPARPRRGANASTSPGSASAAWSSARTSPELGGVLRRVLERDRRPARRSSRPAARRWSRRRPPHPGSSSWSIATVATVPSRPTYSAEPASAGTSRSPRSSARKAVSSRSGLRPGRDPAIRLEQEPLAEDRRRVRLVRAERSLATTSAISRAPPGRERRQGQAGPADERPAPVAAEHPTIRDGQGQRAPDPVAGMRPAGHRPAAVADDERDEVAIGPTRLGRRPRRTPGSRPRRDPRSASASVGRRRTRGRSRRPARTAATPRALPAVPALPVDQVDRQRRLDRRVQDLIITCLTTV